MDFLEELEVMANAASLMVVSDTEDDATPRWQRLFGYSEHEAREKIAVFRADTNRQFIPDAHWDMVRAEKELEGYDREAYEYSSQLMKHQTKGCRKINRAESSSSYLVKLEGPLQTAQAVAHAANLTSEPRVVEGTDSDGTLNSFCEIDGTMKSQIEIYLYNKPDFRPTFIPYSRAAKKLSSISAHPTLSVDSTLPQNRLRVDEAPRPLQSEYPVWYFFYGTLADPEVLSRVLATSCEPVYRSAEVRGGRLDDWGAYKALVDDERGVVSGRAFCVKNEDQEDTLRVYETHNYEVVRCLIEMEGFAGMSVKGLTFRFVKEYV